MRARTHVDICRLRGRGSRVDRSHVQCGTMVLESLVASLLSKYLGQLVDGLSPENLTASISGGRLELSNLKFKPEALRDLNLPLTVKDGFLGHLSIAIPWRSLWSAPTEVVLEDIFILAVPKSNLFDDDFERRLQVTKERFLQLRELLVTAPEDLEKQRAADSSGGLSWTQRLINTIINNVQITVRRVHIRYEDGVSNPERFFAAGVTVDSLVAVSTDEQFVPTFVSHATSLVRKLATLRNAGVYWDTPAAPLRYSDATQFCAAMRAAMMLDSRAPEPQPPHAYVVTPVCAELKVSRGQDRKNAREYSQRPPGVAQPSHGRFEQTKVAIDARIDEVAVALHEGQMRDVLHVADTMRREARGLAFRRLRPAVAVRGHARQWWQYAVRAVQQSRQAMRSVWSGDRLRQLGLDRREYVRIWFTVKAGKQPDAEDAAALAEMEARLDYETLVQLREWGEALWEVKRDEARVAAEDAAAGAGWLGRVWGGAGEAEKEKILNQKLVVSGALLQSIVARAREKRVAAAQADATAAELVRVQVALALGRGRIALRTFDSASATAADMCEIEFLRIAAEVRLLAAATSVRLTMGALIGVDHYTLHGGKRRDLLVPTDVDDTRPILDLALDLAPPDGHADTVVHLHTRAMDIFYSAPLIDRLIAFFATESDVLDAITNTAQDTSVSYQSQLAMQLRQSFSGDTVDKRPVLDLNIVVEAPNIIVPASFDDPECARLVARLGTLEVHSNLDAAHASVTRGDDGKKHVSIDYFYQQSFAVSATRIQLLLAHDANWRDYAQRVPLSSVVEDLSLSMQLSSLTFPTRMLPSIKLVAGLPVALRVNVSPADAVDVLRIIDASLPKAPPQKKAPPPPSLASSMKRNATISLPQTLDETVAVAAAAVPLTGSVSLAASLAVPTEMEQPLPPMDASAQSEFVFDEDIRRNAGDNPTSIDVRFTTAAVELLLYRRNTIMQCTELVRVHLDTLDVRIAQRLHDLRVHAHVHRFGVEDLVVQQRALRWLLDGGMSVETAAVAELEKSAPLPPQLKLTYTGVPVGSTKFAGVEHAVTFVMGAVACDVNRETLLYVLDAVAVFTAGMAQNKSAVAGATTASSAAMVETVETVVEARPLAASRGSRVLAAAAADNRLVQLTVHLGALAMHLNKNTHRFATLSVAASHAQMEMRHSGALRVDAAMGSMEFVHDSAAHTKWARMVHTEVGADRTLECTFEMFPPAAASPADMRVAATLSSIQFVYRNAFVLEVADYFSEMDEMKSLMFESAASTASVVTEQRAAGTRLALDVTVYNPIVLVPRASDSEELLIVDLGKIGLLQDIEPRSNSSSSNRVAMQRLSVSVDAANVRTGVRGMRGADKSVVEDMSASLLLLIPLRNSNAVDDDALPADVADVAISGDLSPVAIVLRQSQLPILFGVLEGNMAELPDIERVFGRTNRLLQPSPTPSPSPMATPSPSPSLSEPLVSAPPPPMQPARSVMRDTLTVNFRWQEFSVALETWELEQRARSTPSPPPVHAAALQQQQKFHATLNSDTSSNVVVPGALPLLPAVESDDEDRVPPVPDTPAVAAPVDAATAAALAEPPGAPPVNASARARKEDKVDVPLARMQVQRLAVALTTRSDEQNSNAASESVLSVGALAMQDQRPQAAHSYFTELVTLGAVAGFDSASTPPPRSTPSPVPSPRATSPYVFASPSPAPVEHQQQQQQPRLLFVELTSSVADGTEVRATLCPITVFVVTPLVLTVARWASDAQLRLTLALAAYARANALIKEREQRQKVVPSQPKNVVANTTSAAQPSLATSRFVANVACKRVELMMIECITLQSSRGLGLALSLFADCVVDRDGTTSVDVDVAHVALAKKRVATGAETQLMLPWSAAMTYRDVPLQSTRIDVIVAPLELVFAHSDYLLASSLARQVIEETSTRDAAADEEMRARLATVVRIEERQNLRRFFTGPSLLDMLLAAGNIELDANRQLALSVGPVQLWGPAGAEREVRFVSLVDSNEDGVSVADHEWDFEGRKILLAADRSWQLSVLQERDVTELGAPVAAVRAGQFDDKLSDWHYSKGGVAEIRTALQPTVVLHAVEMRDGARVTLAAMGGDDRAHQKWSIGAPLSPEQERLQLSGIAATQRPVVDAFKVETLSVAMKGIKARIIDDSGYQMEPLLSLSLKESKAFVSGWSTELSALADISFAADFFNAQMQAWEPLLRGLEGSGTACRERSWQLQCTVKTHADGMMSIDVAALDALSMTVTRAMLGTARRVSETWAMDNEQHQMRIASRAMQPMSRRTLQHISLVARARSSPDVHKQDAAHRSHMLLNSLGVPLMWAVGSMAPRHLSGARGENHVFFDENGPDSGHHARRRLHGGPAPMLSIALGPTPLLRSLPIEGARAIGFNVDGRHIVYDVKYELGTRVLEVRSNVVFVSRLDVDVRLRVMDRNGAGEAIDNNNNIGHGGDRVLRVPAVERYALPLDVAQHPWCIGAPENAPTGSIENDNNKNSPSRFDWCATHFDAASLERDAEKTSGGVLRLVQVLHCDAITLASDDMAAAIGGAVDTSYLATASSSSSRATVWGWACAMSAVGTPDPLSDRLIAWELTLAPPLTVRNLLHADVRYRIVEMRGRADADADAIQEGTIARGDDLAVYAHSEKAVLGIRVQLAGFGWSNAEPLSSGGSGNAADGVSGKLVLSDVAHDRPLEMHYDTVVDGKTRCVSLWLPFWIINRTRMSLLFTSVPRVGAPVPLAGQDERAHDAWDAWRAPMAQWFGPSSADDVIVPVGGVSKLSFRIGDSNAAPGMELASGSSAGTLAITTGHDARRYECGVRVFSAPSNYWRTKIVQVDNRFHLVNATDRTLFVKQKGTAHTLELAPNTQMPFHWMNATENPNDLLLRVRLAKHEREGAWHWCGAFAVKEVSLFEVATITKSGALRARLTVQTTTDVPVTAVIFRPATSFSIYKLRNNLMVPVLVRQRGVANDDGEWLNPQAVMPFSWPEPSIERPRVTICIAQGGVLVGPADSHTDYYADDAHNGVNGAFTPSFSLDTATDSLPPLRARLDNGVEILVAVRVVMDGASKVLELSEGSGGAGQNGIAGMSLVRVNKVALRASLQLGGIGVALVDGCPREVFHVFLRNISAHYSDGSAETLIGLDVARIQADSMLYSSVFPLVLHPRNPADKHFLHVAINQAKGYEGVRFFNGIEMVMQEADVWLDEACLTHTLVAVEDLLALTQDDDVDFAHLARPVADYRLRAFTTADMVYARELYIGPICLGMSYSSLPWAAATVKGDAGAQLHEWLGFIHEIDNVRLALGMLDLDDAYHSQTELVRVIVHHYRHQILSSFYSLLGAVPVLGAPTELFRGVTTGVKDVFFLPASGITRSPADFGDGLRAGSSALFKGTVGTLFREIGKATTTASRQAAKLTLDEDYQLARLKTSKVQAKSAGQGVLFAARDVGKGFVDGVAGLVMNPIKGAHRDGAGGFFKGVGTGMLGVVTKPIVGVLDASSQLSNGIKNAGKQTDRTRVRRPRQFDATGVLLPYDGSAAEAQELLHTIDASLHAASYAVFHHPELGALNYGNFKLPPVHTRVLLSNKMVFCIAGNEIGAVKTLWRIALRYVGHVMVRQRSVVLVDEQHGAVRDVELPTIEQALLVYFKIARAVKDENAKDSELVKLRRLNADRGDSHNVLADLLNERERHTSTFMSTAMEDMRRSPRTPRQKKVTMGGARASKGGGALLDPKGKDEQ